MLSDLAMLVLVAAWGFAFAGFVWLCRRLMG